MTEDEPRNVGEEAFKNNNVEPANRRRYEILMGVVIWGAAAVIGIGGLYLLGLWVDH